MSKRSSKPGQGAGAMPEIANLPALIDLTTRQLGEARDLATVREIKNRAEALKVYVKKHGGLIEAHNRLAGIIALAERRIGQEIRAGQKRGEVAARGGVSGRGKLQDQEFASDKPVTLADLDIDYNQSAEYQQLADVTENVLLDAIAEAGVQGREISKADIRRAAKRYRQQQSARPEPAPVETADARAAQELWDAGESTRAVWTPIAQALEALLRLPEPAEAFSQYHEPYDFSLCRTVPRAHEWIVKFMTEWEKRRGSRRIPKNGQRRLG